MMSRREYMVYYTRVTDDEGEIELRMCVEAKDDDEAIAKVRDTLRGRICWMRATLLPLKRTCISQR